jgi:hypothetical protein
VLATSQITPAGWFALGAPVDDGISHVENIFAAGDLFGAGAVMPPGSVTVLGTITIHVGVDPGGGHSVLVGATSIGDDIIANSAIFSILNEFTFGAGTITHAGGTVVPEPNAAILFGIGSLVVADGLRRRRGRR